MNRIRAGGYSGRGIHGEVVEELGQRIVGGRLAEGETIDVVALEAELDISKTVVREALRVLKAKGLVDARQKRGTFVQPRSEWRLLDPDVIRWQFGGRADTQFLDDLAEVRGIFEPASARLAAVRHDEGDIAAMERALELMSAAAAGRGNAVEADLAFHRALLASTHNELLTRMEVVLEAGLAARDVLVHGAVEDDDPTPAHAAVLDAIRDRDPDRAADAASALLAKSLLDLDRARSSATQQEGP
ncbi:DNA-binding FadR family transcriptional regulator [Kribbella sp. VKM Ac-2527]|uniref:DNA-binding FadR family transcriptional regulator n=1 Tax=Kribbella caucasensis TaxID=2512215 RepID=A0A4R6KQU2_9ACTN|nr:FCD domain-containing protein [Kribbella sp. VKM Ac-2527]TDO52209.1 DNA-binding FadR family transcriptional regulator [Kribbella sp. VKM Ac-2527]